MFYTRSLASSLGRVINRSWILPNSEKYNTNLIQFNLAKQYCKMSEQTVTYEDVVSYKDKPEVMLIDVRDPNELQETGVLPASINIPLGQVNDVLKNMSPTEFKTKFGRDFPEKDTELVFSCKLGGRANKAMDTAIALGFTNSKFYKGSWTEWASKQ